MVWLDEPLADANEATVHEAALQQVVNGFEEERPALVGQAALPLAILLAWNKDTALSHESNKVPNVKRKQEHMSETCQHYSVSKLNGTTKAI